MAELTMKGEHALQSEKWSIWSCAPDGTCADRAV